MCIFCVGLFLARKLLATERFSLLESRLLLLQIVTCITSSSSFATKLLLLLHSVFNGCVNYFSSRHANLCVFVVDLLSRSDVTLGLLYLELRGRDSNCQKKNTSDDQELETRYLQGCCLNSVVCFVF